MPFDFEVAFHDRNMPAPATPTVPVTPTPKSGARRKVAIVKVHRKSELLGYYSIKVLRFL